MTVERLLKIYSLVSSGDEIEIPGGGEEGLVKNFLALNDGPPPSRIHSVWRKDPRGSVSVGPEASYPYLVITKG